MKSANTSNKNTETKAPVNNNTNVKEENNNMKDNKKEEKLFGHKAIAAEFLRIKGASRDKDLSTKDLTIVNIDLPLPKDAAKDAKPETIKLACIDGSFSSTAGSEDVKDKAGAIAAADDFVKTFKTSYSFSIVRIFRSCVKGFFSKTWVKHTVLAVATVALAALYFVEPIYAVAAVIPYTAHGITKLTGYVSRKLEARKAKKDSATDAPKDAAPEAA